MSEEQEQKLSKYQELLLKNKFNPDSVLPKKEEPKEEDFRRSYKLLNGLNEFRLIAWDDNGSIVVKNWIHMNLGIPFFCPNKLDRSERCPDCDFGWKLYNDNGKKHTDESRNFLAQEKWTIRGIVRSLEESDMEKFGYPKIRFIDLSPTNGATVESYFAPAQIKKWGDLSDYFKGRDIELTKDEVKAKARQASTVIERSAVQTPVFAHVELTDPKFEEMFVNMFDNTVDNNDRFERKSYKEILELMETFRQKTARRENHTQTEDFTVTASEFSEASSSLEKNEELEMIAKRF